MLRLKSPWQTHNSRRARTTLFFTVKIHEAAKRAGLPIEFLKSEIDVLLRAKRRSRR